MKYEALINNLEKNQVPKELFSLNEGLKPNAHILTKIYNYWEYFFLDEKGDRYGLRTFSNDELAFDYLWEELLDEIKDLPSIPPPSVGI